MHDIVKPPVAERSASVSVELTAIRKTFTRGEDAVSIDTLHIQPSEFITLVGPSGCGKTTTMRMIAGLEDPTAGDIHFGGRRVNEMSVQKRNIAMVFQNYALYPHLRVADNLQYGLRKRRVPIAERQRRVEWVARLLHIERLLERKPRQLSGGEQQRVALGRAIIRTPDVLLLDEPLSNLDAKLRTVMRAELVKLQREVGCTTIFVTHDQLEAMTMSDRIAVMNGGRIQQLAAPYEIYDRPANLFVAGFIGSPPMNLIEGRLSRRDGRAQFEAPGIQCTLKMAAAGFAEDGNVTLGIRPEAVILGGDEGDVAAVVSLVELIGAEKYVLLDTPAGQIIARVGADFAVAAGDRVGCTFQQNKIRLFSTATGEALAEQGLGADEPR